MVAIYLLQNLERQLMARRYLNEYGDGDSIDEVFLLAEVQLRANRNANMYLLVQLRDKSGTMSGLMWNVAEGEYEDLTAGDYVNVRGKVQLYQGGLQMILTGVRTVSAEGLDPDEYRPSSGKDAERLMARMKEILLSIDDPHIKALMECFLIDDALMSDFSRAPAGIKAHHAWHGGLVEHVVNILEVAVRISDLYPAIDFNYLLAGIFLHDLGKVRELGYEATFSYTDEGQLLGHMMIGVEILTEKIAETTALTGEEFPEETALRLKHMIISHHGTYEFGSSKLPMTPEAVALHHLDNLDAKVQEFSRTIEEDPNGKSAWTHFIPRLERKLYKGTSE